MSLFELILGTYEEFTLGYQYRPDNVSLSQSFASHSHSASIRCLAQAGPFIATGGADDRIVVYNLKTRKEHCMLTHHNGTINSLKFNDECTHLFSAGQDGIFAITRIGNWQVEKLWEKAHRGAAVLDIAVHKTGKLALTLGLDATLRTWNLIKGRRAYIINLNRKCLDVRGLSDVIFGPNCVRFCLNGGRSTEIWSIETGGQTSIIDHGSIKVASCAWLDEDNLLAGLDDGNISRISIGTDGKAVITSTHKAHDSRVKCLSIIRNVRNENDISQVVSAASSGEIKIWSADLETCLSRITADCRLTCLVVADISSFIKKEEVQEASVSVDLEMSRIIKKAKPATRKGVVVIEMDEDETKEQSNLKIDNKRIQNEKGNPRKMDTKNVVNEKLGKFEVKETKNKLENVKKVKRLEKVADTSMGIKKKKFKMKRNVKI